MDDVTLLSHTIDPEYDTPVAFIFATLLCDLDVESSRWHFLTGQKDSIYKTAQTSYFATAMEDKMNPMVSSTAVLLLIDREGHICGK